MEDRIVLFGTGEDLKKCLGILHELGIKPYCFTDNDCSKWDTMIDGKRIAASSELARMGCRILISSSDYKEQIMNQLREMGLEDRIRLDKILCVSKRIQKRLEKEWHIPKEKIYYKINPVLWDPCEDLQGVERDRRWDLADAPIRIGWGGRLTASQKRADLLPVLIEELEREGIDYCLEIAGDGSSYSMIKEYLEKNGLEKRVHLLGRLESGSMKAFWKHQQIYINLSEYEGSCLAMLEAMECGVVPVVPEVSGTEDCVFDFETGFRVGIGAVKEIVEKIKYLSEHSDMGKYMSQKAMQLVKECCNLDSYIIHGFYRNVYSINLLRGFDFEKDDNIWSRTVW